MTWVKKTAAAAMARPMTAIATGFISRAFPAGRRCPAKNPQLFAAGLRRQPRSPPDMPNFILRGAGWQPLRSAGLRASPGRRPNEYGEDVAGFALTQVHRELRELVRALDIGRLYDARNAQIHLITYFRLDGPLPGAAAGWLSVVIFKLSSNT